VRSYVAGTDLAIQVVFEVDGENAVPDAGSVSYTLRDKAGASITSYVDLAVTTDENTTQISVAVPAAVNAKTLNFENRTVSVKFKVSGQTYFIDRSYRLVDRIPMSADANSCRSLLGLAANELPDDDLDLPMAYYLVTSDDDVSKSTFDNALSAGTKVQHAANRAIVCRALLEVLPSMQMRTLQSEKSQTSSASRFVTLDFKKIENWLQGLYAAAKATVSGTPQDSLPLLQLATPTDVITGA
jgi:hypothetical protein